MNQFQSWYRMQPRALRALLTINVVIYVLWVVVLMRVGATQVFFLEHLALNPALPGVLFEPWQLVTYNFLHLSPGFWGFLHILFNMLWLVWIGREYEELHGAHRLLALYLLTGIGGGLLTVLFYAAFPGNVIVYGASASVIGVMTAVAIKYPYKSIALIFIGTVRLIYVVIGFLVLDLLLSSGSSTAITAHLGGALCGFLYAKAEDRGWDLAGWARVFFPDRRAARTRGRSAPAEKAGVLGRMESWLSSKGGGRGGVRGGASEREAAVYPISSAGTAQTPVEPKTSAEEEVDRILDKISARGYDALTDEEKRLLYEASRR